VEICPTQTQAPSTAQYSRAGQLARQLMIVVCFRRIAIRARWRKSPEVSRERRQGQRPADRRGELWLRGKGRPFSAINISPVYGQASCICDLRLIDQFVRRSLRRSCRLIPHHTLQTTSYFHHNPRSITELQPQTPHP